MFSSKPALSSKRPKFGPLQVRTVEGIKPGNTLIQISGLMNGSKTRLLIISEPYSYTIDDDETPSTKITYLVLSGCMKGWIKEDFLSDLSVKPYLPQAFWNTVHHLRRTGRKRLNKKQIAAKIDKYFTSDSIDCREH